MTLLDAFFLAVMVYTALVFSVGFAFGCFWGSGQPETSPLEEDPWLFKPHLIVDNTPKDAA